MAAGRTSASGQDERGAGAHPSARRDDAVAVRQSPGEETIPKGFLHKKRGSFTASCFPTHTLLSLRGVCPKGNLSK